MSTEVYPIEHQGGHKVESEGVGKVTPKSSEETVESPEEEVAVPGQEVKDIENSELMCNNEEGIPEEVAEAQEGLPDGLRGRRFNDFYELQQAAEELEYGDTRFTLDGNGYAIMPSPEHGRACDFLRDELDDLSKGWLGRWGKAKSDNAQEVNRPTRRNPTSRREPDAAFWGYQKCEYVKPGNRRIYKVKKVPGSRYNFDPDVVINFSWENKWEAEVNAMNDMMNIGGLGNTNVQPHVGFLIKIIKSGNPRVATGLNIYRIPRGCTVDDAINGTNGASHFVYTHGQMNDVFIEITPEELGFEGRWARVSPSFRLSMKELWAIGEFV